MNRCHKTILLAVLVMVTWSCTGCRSIRKAPPGYGWVPVESALARLSDNQKRVLSSDGPPSAVWITPVLSVLWVYCQDGSPIGAIEFSEHIEKLGEIRGQGNLCERPIHD